MKKLSISIIFALLLVASVFAQTVPQGMKYQAVARDLSGDIMANQQVFLQVQLQSNIKSQQVYYSENHIITTNQFGLFSLVIGEGVSNKGDFTKIPWSTDDIWMGVAIKEGENNNYTTISNSKLLAVPYAFHSASASKLTEKGGNNGMRGVPAQVWSLKGNRNTDPETDKMGTTDYTDLVFVTDNLERLRITAEGTIEIAGSLDVKKDLSVGGDVFLNYDDNLSPLGETFNYGNFTVEDMSSTYLTGTLTVDKEVLFTDNSSSTTTTDGALVVTGGVGIGENLNVGGNIFAPIYFDSNNLNYYLNPNGSSRLYNAYLTNNLTVGNRAIVGDSGRRDATLTIQSPSMVRFPMYAAVTGTSNFFHMNREGQLYLRSTKAGHSGDEDNYAMRLDAQNQGLMIRINERSFPNSSNKYISFWGSDNNVRGRIEGQTLGEHLRDPLNIAKDVFFAAIAVAEGFAIAAAPVEPSGVVSLAAQLVLCDVQIGHGINNVGVSYSSGFGDYAEWLERKDLGEKTTFGDIIGVKGGKISKTTNGADHFMIVSKNPIVLGNMPENGKEHKYEKVAFMGQVPVKMIGKVNIGDYILPSGRNDGFGIAVSPKNMTIDDYQKIAGVSWSNKNDDLFGYVNVAVGINSNDIARTVKIQYEELSAEIDMIKEAIGLKEKTINTTNTFDQIKTTVSINKISEAANEVLIKEKNNNHMSQLLSNDDIFYKSLSALKEGFEKRGYDIEKNPALKRLLTDKNYQKEIIERGKTKKH